MLPRFFRSWRNRSISDRDRLDERRALESVLEETTDADKHLFLEMHLGTEAAEFWNSDAGSYLRGACQTMIDNAIKVLAEVSPLDHVRIGQAQVDLRAARKIVHTVTAAIQAGDAAEIEIHNRHNEDRGHGQDQ